MKRKIIAVFLALIGLSIIGASTLYFLGGFKKQKAGLLIETTPESNIYINSQFIGKTPYENTFDAKSINLNIKPISNDGKILDDYETKIDLVPGVQTIINRNFNEKDEDTDGAVVSFDKLDKDLSYVTVISVPDNAQVLIDKKNYGHTPLKVAIPAGDHNLEVIAINYKPIVLPIKVYKGYKLTASVKLAVDYREPQEEQLAVLAETVESLGRIKINKTDIGYLRVRAGANTGFPEVGRVHEGEEYEILEEGEQVSWYKIQIPDEEGQPVNRQGWVSAEFVTKL